MPLLSKKKFVKKMHSTSKSSVTKENIDKVLGKSKTPTNSSNVPSSKNSTISLKSMKNSIRKVLSTQSSSDEMSSERHDSDISYRMNEPAIKAAYVQFMKNLDQRSLNNTVCSTPTLDKQNESEDIFTPSQMSSVLEEIKVLIGNDKEKTSGDSGFPPTQEIFRMKDIEEIEPCTNYKNNMMEKEMDEFNFMKNFKEPAKKKTRNSISISTRESFKRSSIQKEVEGSEKEYDKKKTEQNRKRAEKRISKKQERSESVLKEPRTNKDKAVEQKNENSRKRITERAEEIEMPLYEKMLLIQESRNVGLYCLCDICDKARYLPDVKDPLDLPEKWYCSMNPDPNHNKCSDPEEALIDEEFLIENLYNAGSIVWAKMDGYPWWPAMVEDDPDYEDYFYLEEKHGLKPTFYHVTFFDSYAVTRAWLRPNCLKPLKINKTNLELQIPKYKKFKSRVEFAFKQAEDALKLSLIARLKKYSFIQRVKGKCSKRASKSKVQDCQEISIAKKKSRIYKKLSSSNSENSNISIILDNMDWQNDNINLNVFDKLV